MTQFRSFCLTNIIVPIANHNTSYFLFRSLMASAQSQLCPSSYFLFWYHNQAHNHNTAHHPISFSELLWQVYNHNSARCLISFSNLLWQVHNHNSAHCLISFSNLLWQVHNHNSACLLISFSDLSWQVHNHNSACRLIAFSDPLWQVHNHNSAHCLKQASKRASFLLSRSWLVLVLKMDERGSAVILDRSLSRNIDQDPRVWALFFQYNNKTTFWPIRVSIKDFWQVPHCVWKV